MQQISDSTWRVDEVPEWRGFVLELIEPGGYVLSRGADLFVAKKLGGSMRRIGRIPLPFWREWISKIGVGRRLFRLIYFNVVPLEGNRYFVTFDRMMGIIDDQQFNLIPTDRPFRILRQGICYSDGKIFFGEYIGNAERGPVRIFEANLKQKNPSLKIAHSFSPGEVRHIHRIQCDPFSNEIWCMTGDKPDESQIFCSKDNFCSIELVGGGDESWRCVSPIFTKRFIYYATDSEFSTNAIYRIDRANGCREHICEIDGPVYYSILVGDRMFFATVAEGCPSQAELVASLWHLDHKKEKATASKLFSYRKDWLSPKWFLPGMLTFPSRYDGCTDLFLFNGLGLFGADHKIFSLSKS